jgi:hypothetical protein
LAPRHCRRQADNPFRAERLGPRPKANVGTAFERAQPEGTGFTQAKSPWRTRARAHDIAEEGLDKLIEGDTETSEQLIDKVANRSEAVEELAEEVKRHNENAERFVNKC